MVKRFNIKTMKKEEVRRRWGHWKKKRRIRKRWEEGVLLIDVSRKLLVDLKSMGRDSLNS